MDVAPALLGEALDATTCGVPAEPETLVAEFVVFGTPVSAQTKLKPRKRAWQADVSNAARDEWPGAPPASELHVHIAYFQPGGWELDLDNMAKPIADAISGVIWKDDKQLLTMTAKRRQLFGLYVLKDASAVLVAALNEKRPFVYVRIDSPYDQEILP